MKRSTLIALVLLLVVAAIAYVALQNPQEELIRPLTLGPFHLAPAPGTAPEEEAVDRVVIEGPHGSVTLVRHASGGWFVGEDFGAPVEDRMVEAIAGLFKVAMESDFAGRIAEDSLDLYGLSEKDRIRLKLMDKDQTRLDLWVGFAPESGGASRATWIQKSDSDVVYRMVGVDLRAPLDRNLQQFRSKKLFVFQPDLVTRLEILDPRGGSERRLIASASPSSTQGTSGKRVWTTLEPADKPVEGLDSYVKSLSELTASEYLSQLPSPDARALDQTYQITLETEDNARYQLFLGARRGQAVYARLGEDGEILTIDANAAKPLLRSLEDLRPRKPFDFQSSDIDSVSIERPSGPRFLMQRTGPEEMKAVEPAGFLLDATKSRTLLSNLGSFVVKEFLASPPDLAVAGLDKATTLVRIRLKSDAGKAKDSFEIVLGGLVDPADKLKGRYARLGVGGEIVILSDSKAESIAPVLEELRDQRVFRIEKEDITRIQLQYPDESLLLESRQEGDQTVWDLAAPQHIEGVNVSSMIYNLARLDSQPGGPLPAPPEAHLDLGTIRVTLTLKDGSSHSVTFSEEVKDDANYAMSDEPDFAGRYFMVSKHKVATILKKLPDFQPKTP